MNSSIQADGGQSAAPAPSGGGIAPRSRWKRAVLMLAVLLLGVLIGWLLAPRCNSKSCASGDGTVSSDGGASGGKGAPMKLNQGEGSGDAPGGSGHASGAVKSGGGGSGGDSGGGADAARGHDGQGDGGGGGQRDADSGDPLDSAVARHAQGLDAAGGGASGTCPAQRRGNC